MKPISIMRWDRGSICSFVFLSAMQISRLANPILEHGLQPRLSIKMFDSFVILCSRGGGPPWRHTRLEGS